MYLNEFDRRKLDEEDDSIFYSEPRLVYHLDQNFRRRLKKLYSDYLKPGIVVLDLMSSWVSHLPNDIKFYKVIGHGMNEKELSQNKQLTEFWIQNLNNNQVLPLPNDSIDACLMVAGWQYLQYPENLVVEISRISKVNALILISFSNRAFWNKSPNIWIDNDSIGRINYIKKILTSKGWSLEKIIVEERQYSLFNPFNLSADPFISVIARNNESKNID